MPAFRQVGEKQLPNPILYMAWSPKRDLIALANTAGEVRSFIDIHIQYLSSVKPLLMSIDPNLYDCIEGFIRLSCHYSFSCIGLPTFSGCGVYRPMRTPGKRSHHWLGDLMGKVNPNSISLPDSSQF